MPPVIFALAAQAVALAACAALPGNLPAWPAALVQGAVAAAAGHALRLPVWWVPLNFAFAPAALWIGTLALPPAWFLAAFAVLALLYWTTYRTRVPLFLSSTEACDALHALLPHQPGVLVADLGCGLGDVIARVGRARPNARFVGYELAPLPAAIAWLRTRTNPNAAVLRRDFWHESLREYDIVYAFLSPAPMPELWRKARAEMKPGALLVSNSFAIPGTEPDHVIPLTGRGSSALYIWRM
jgi:hypothetical protein